MAELAATASASEVTASATRLPGPCSMNALEQNCPQDACCKSSVWSFCWMARAAASSSRRTLSMFMFSKCLEAFCFCSTCAWDNGAANVGTTVPSSVQIRVHSKRGIRPERQSRLLPGNRAEHQNLRLTAITIKSSYQLIRNGCCDSSSSLSG